MARSRVPSTFKTGGFHASCTFINARMEHYSLLPSKCRVPVALHTAMLEGSTTVILPSKCHVPVSLHTAMLEWSTTVVLPSKCHVSLSLFHQFALDNTRIRTLMSKVIKVYLYYRDPNGFVRESHLHSKLKVFKRLLNIL